MNRLLRRSLATALVTVLALGLAATATAQTNFYSSRADFESDFPGLAVEDFEEGRVAPGGAQACPSPVNSFSNDACFQPGEIIAGVDFTQGPVVDDMSIVGAGLFGPTQPSIILGPTSFNDRFFINFTTSIFAAGMDVMPNASGTIRIDIFDGPGGAGTLLATTTLNVVAFQFQFIGVESSTELGSIVMTGIANAGNSLGEFIDDFSMSPLPIPVELTAFGATTDGLDVTLAWETASETNNAGFEVQMRRPGQDGFEALTFVEGHGTTTEAQTYRHTVAGLTVGTHTFRLKQIDFDGAFAYSDDVEATIEVIGTHALGTAYPNPFNPSSQFTLAVAQDQRVTVGLYNLLGQRMAVLFDGTLAAGVTHAMTLDGTGLPSGAYVVRAEGVTFTDTFRVTLLK